MSPQEYDNRQSGLFSTSPSHPHTCSKVVMVPVQAFFTTMPATFGACASGAPCWDEQHVPFVATQFAVPDVRACRGRTWVGGGHGAHAASHGIGPGRRLGPKPIVNKVSILEVVVREHGVVIAIETA